MSDTKSLVADTYAGLARLLEAADPESWDAPSLCERWKVRHVVAHVSMPVALTPQEFGAEMAAAGGDFTTMSDAMAERLAPDTVEEHLARLRSEHLHDWEPPGGGAAGALNHAVIHSLDVTVALDHPAVAPPEALVSVLDQLTSANGSYFGLDFSGSRFEAEDLDWSWGRGETVRASAASLVALMSGRTLPDGRSLPRG